MIPEGSRRVEFGLGLIGIGKPWGFANAVVPDERQALALAGTAAGRFSQSNQAIPAGTP